MIQIQKPKKSYTHAVDRAVADYYSSLPSKGSEEQTGRIPVQNRHA